MSRQKAILLVIISAIMIGGSYLLKTRYMVDTATSPKPVVSIDGASPTFGMKSTDELIVFWKNRFEHNPQDFISLTYLAQSHVRKGRETGDVPVLHHPLQLAGGKEAATDVVVPRGLSELLQLDQRIRHHHLPSNPPWRCSCAIVRRGS